MSAEGSRVHRELVNETQPSTTGDDEKTIGASGLRIDQAEILRAIKAYPH